MTYEPGVLEDVNNAHMHPLGTYLLLRPIRNERDDYRWPSEASEFRLIEAGSFEEVTDLALLEKERLAGHYADQEMPVIAQVIDHGIYNGLMNGQRRMFGPTLGGHPMDGCYWDHGYHRLYQLPVEGSPAFDSTLFVRILGEIKVSSSELKLKVELPDRPAT